MTLNKKYVSFAVALVSTLIGVSAVVDPFVPPKYKGAVVATVSVLNYLMLSPIAATFGVKTLPQGS